MIKRKYIINPKFLFYDNIEKEYNFYDRLSRLNTVINEQSIQTRIVFPKEVADILSSYIFASNKINLKKRHDIYKIVTMFLSKVKFQTLDEEENCDYIINPESIKNIFESVFPRSFINTIFKNKIFSMLSSEDFDIPIIETEIVISFSEDLRVRVFYIEREKQFFPYFLPSKKHCYLRNYENQDHDSILEKDDHDACYKLIKKAHLSNDNSDSLFAYNKLTDRYIRFNRDGVDGESYHAFPVKIDKDPLLNPRFAEQLKNFFE
ncbi:Uncharacterised protein [Acholeplasma oculi]|uniref:Uncharacterized protein n=1 Tax=Acholeplasma oculi TaxID=35623 RepID=A0A061AHR6_9MOLU|nr:hypothetical protein [Acholeplasma oculi]CDR30517.1 hypothetical protein Aocu_04440 [Acholeplasma oculi]SKC47648.1 hypothetical protein SAMN02745122_1308 [Acholeplasma oculi]SUT89168.1 Uncharacterised protein [Acholeplasma oculi]